jgi:peroxiredoxin family protein
LVVKPLLFTSLAYNAINAMKQADSKMMKNNDIAAHKHLCAAATAVMIVVCTIVMPSYF